MAAVLVNNVQYRPIFPKSMKIGRYCTLFRRPRGPRSGQACALPPPYIWNRATIRGIVTMQSRIDVTLIALAYFASRW